VTQPSSTGGVPPTTGGQSIGGAKPQSTGGVPLTTGAQQPPIGGGIHPQKPAEEDTTPAG